MTSLPDRTPDPRTGEYEVPSTTRGIFEELPDLWYEATTQGELARLTERIEVLSNQIGQLCTEMQGRPAKWTMQILDLGDPSYKLLRSLPVLIEEYEDDDLVYARVPELEVFGEGVTDTEAIANLRLAILDLYDELMEGSPDQLGPLPLTWRRILASIIVKDQMR